MSCLNSARFPYEPVGLSDRDSASEGEDWAGDWDTTSCCTTPSGALLLNEHFDISQVIVLSCRHLLKMYSMHVTDASGESGPLLLVAGGLQQYLIKTMREKKEADCEQPRKGLGSESTTFQDLPDSLQLKIFSFLDCGRLCQVSRVCRHWYCIASDDILWKKKLQLDVNRWNVIGHTTNPRMYAECGSDWFSKEM